MTDWRSSMLRGMEPEAALQLEVNLHAITERSRAEMGDRMKMIGAIVESFRDCGMLNGETMFRTLYPHLWEYMEDGWGEESWMTKARGES